MNFSFISQLLNSKYLNSDFISKYLTSDNIIIVGLLFVLYMEGVEDMGLFISLVALLLEI